MILRALIIMGAGAKLLNKRLARKRAALAARKEVKIEAPLSSTDSQRHLSP